MPSDSVFDVHETSTISLALYEVPCASLSDISTEADVFMETWFAYVLVDNSKKHEWKRMNKIEIDQDTGLTKENHVLQLAAVGQITGENMGLFNVIPSMISFDSLEKLVKGILSMSYYERNLNL